MSYAVVIEPVPVTENLPGMYYAHVPTLGLTTHGMGIEGARAAAKDLLMLWLEEKRENGEEIISGNDAILTTVEVG
jgi:predicted RNase H-like HicB family nuclease